MKQLISRTGTNLEVITNSNQRLLFPLFDETRGSTDCEFNNEIETDNRSSTSAHLAYLDSMQPNKYKKKESPNPDSLSSRLKRLFCFDQHSYSHLPLVCKQLPESYRDKIKYG